MGRVRPNLRVRKNGVIIHFGRCKKTVLRIEMCRDLFVCSSAVVLLHNLSSKENREPLSRDHIVSSQLYSERSRNYLFHTSSGLTRQWSGGVQTSNKHFDVAYFPSWMFLRSSLPQHGFSFLVVFMAPSREGKPEKQQARHSMCCVAVSQKGLLLSRALPEMRVAVGLAYGN